MVSKLVKWFPYWVIERYFVKQNNWYRMWLTKTENEPDEHWVNETYLQEQTEVNVCRVDNSTWICKKTKSVLENLRDEYIEKIEELNKEIGD